MKRLRQGQEKLIGGDVLELAEIVRDGALRQRTPTLAYSGKERRLYAKARHLLAQEISCACRLDADEADAWIEEQPAKKGEDGLSRFCFGELLRRGGAGGVPLAP